jgi:hypothetical protein
MIVFKELFMADVEDPELYAAQPILSWQESEQGQWVMENALEQPCFRIMPSIETMGYKIQIYGQLSEPDEVYYRLKYGFSSVHF